ncbi:MAG: hypothetical protein HY243_15610 [Proteobacteria bacterium]|nr:hypothetical protein [Pseudomonadota bacterium]
MSKRTKRKTREKSLALPHPGHGGFAPVLQEPRNLSAQERACGDFALENVNIDRLRWLCARKWIDQHHYEAGVRLQRDWEMAMIMPVASSVIVGSGGGTQLPGDAKVDAMKRHASAMAALGARGRSIVELVVLGEEGGVSVEKAAAILRLHPKRAIERLVFALDLLAEHYGMAARAGRLR